MSIWTVTIFIWYLMLFYFKQAIVSGSLLHLNYLFEKAFRMLIRWDCVDCRSCGDIDLQKVSLMSIEPYTIYIAFRFSWVYNTTLLQMKFGHRLKYWNQRQSYFGVNNGWCNSEGNVAHDSKRDKLYGVWRCAIVPTDDGFFTLDPRKCKQREDDM